MTHSLTWSMTEVFVEQPPLRRVCQKYECEQKQICLHLERFSYIYQHVATSLLFRGDTLTEPQAMPGLNVMLWSSKWETSGGRDGGPREAGGALGDGGGKNK